MRGMRTLFIGAQMLYIGLSLQWGVDIFNRQMWVAAGFFFLRREKREILILSSPFPTSDPGEK